MFVRGGLTQRGGSDLAPEIVKTGHEFDRFTDICVKVCKTVSLYLASEDQCKACSSGYLDSLGKTGK